MSSSIRVHVTFSDTCLTATTWFDNSNEFYRVRFALAILLKRENGKMTEKRTRVGVSIYNLCIKEIVDTL